MFGGSRLARESAPDPKIGGGGSLLRLEQRQQHAEFEPGVPSLQGTVAEPVPQIAEWRLGPCCLECIERYSQGSLDQERGGAGRELPGGDVEPCRPVRGDGL